MDIRKLKHFVALCDHGTFHRAAEAVHLSQSALSRSIQSLEQEMDVTLVDRSGHRSLLTPFGKALLARARRMILESNEIHRELALMRGGDAGSVNLGLSPTPASVLLRPCMVELAREHPRLRINAFMGRTPELIDELRAERYDLVVVDSSAILDPEGLAIERLPDQPGDFLCRRGHPILSLPQRDLGAVRRYPVSCSVVSGDLTRRLVDAFGPDGHPDRLVTFCCDSYDIQREVALESDMILMSVFSAVRREIESGALVPLGLFPPSLVGRYAVVRLAGRTPAPALALIYAIARRLFGPGGL